MQGYLFTFIYFMVHHYVDIRKSSTKLFYPDNQKRACIIKQALSTHILFNYIRSPSISLLLATNAVIASGLSGLFAITAKS